jgi:hypothetical protein
MHANLINEYRRIRHTWHGRASMALAVARKAIATGATSPVGYPSFLPGNGIGAPFQCASEPCRWVEKPADYGLRFVGFADDVAARSIRHTGWFVGDECGEKARGVVFQLPARNGSPVFVAGIADPYNDGPAIVAFTHTTDDATTAAIWADQIAESYADEERDNQRVTSARIRFDELADNVAQVRKCSLSLIREIKQSGTLRPAVCAALRKAVVEQIEFIRAMRTERADIAHAFSSHAAWNA